MKNRFHRAFAITLVALTFSEISFAATYTAALLESNSKAFSINRFGQVVGQAGDKATVWSGLTVTQLVPLSVPSSYTYAASINDLGQIVGASGSNQQPTLWTNGVPAALSPIPVNGQLLPGSTSQINNFGQVVGSLNTGAQFWDGVNSKYFGSGTGSANGINDLGQVVGATHEINSSDYNLHAFTWQQNSLDVAFLSSLGTGASSANGINENGQIVGASTNKDGHIRAVVWKDSEVTDLGALGGVSSSAMRINEKSQIVGWASNSAGAHHAALWDGGAPIDLNTYLSEDLISEGWILRTASDINDDGTIVGTAERLIRAADPSNPMSYAIWEIRGFILSVGVVPESSTYALMVAGLGLMGFVVRRSRVLQ